jgi:RNA polymerase sigma-70 factor (ECF subfamily)
VPLCRYALKLVNDKAVAEDVVQECFAYLWENWSRLAQTDSLKYYLFKSVKNGSLNYLKAKFVQSKDPFPCEFNEKISDRQPSAQELMEVHDLEAILEKALLHLPERCRTIFVLKRFDEKSNKEIAGLLGISVKTVEAQMTIALARLRNHMIKFWGSSGIILFNFFLQNKK